MGAGTWAWGNQFLWGYDPAKDQELRDTFDVLLRGGVNFLDTADSYGTGQLEGRSEKLIGQFCAGNKDADKLIIGTKFAVRTLRGERVYVTSAERSLTSFLPAGCPPRSPTPRGSPLTPSSTPPATRSSASDASASSWDSSTGA